MRTLVWFRGKELRLADHAPLLGALRGEVIPLFVLDPYFFAPERARELPHRMQFLLESLRALEERIAQLGSRLVVVAGKSIELVPGVAKRWRVDRVVAQRWTEPFGRERDRRIAEALGAIPFELHDGETLAPPGALRTKSGTPFQVFTPFAKAFREQIVVPPPRPAPRSLPPLPRDIAIPSAPIPTLASLGLARNERLVDGGEAAARARLRAFVRGPAPRYHTLRDAVGVAGTSRISQDLKFGTLSPRAAWHAVEDVPRTAREQFRTELLWRDYMHALLHDHPRLLEEPFDVRFRDFPWFDGHGTAWDAWVSGQTGYPIVDAAARQLLTEGFVHNRARMISASFLTKHLLVHYRHGEAHYLKYLVDGDWAQNNGGWQWSAGCGVDAQPYFRVFNPVLQGERFDPDGAYVKRYVPELAQLPARHVHAPWDAPADVLRRAGVILDRTYPRPIVDHAMARARFLALASEHLRRAAAA